MVRHPPPGSTRLPGTERREKDALEGMQDQRWSSILHAAPPRQAHHRCAGLPVPRRRRSYRAREMSLIMKATRVIFIFKKPTAQVVRLR